MTATAKSIMRWVRTGIAKSIEKLTIKRGLTISLKIYRVGEMSRTKEEMNGLSVLLNNTGANKADIDNAPEEFKKKAGRPKKVVIEDKEWAGMMVPGEIYKICIFIKGLLEKTNRYTEEFELQIYNAAVQQYLYNKLITDMIKQREPVPARNLVTCSESLRRAYQALGLTIMDKKSAVTRETSGKSPLSDFLDAMNKDDEEEVLVKKKNSK